MLNLKKTLLPRGWDPPMGKFDENGQLITMHNELLQLYMRTYQYRLRQREIRPEFGETLQLKNMLWESISYLLSFQKSSDWKLSEFNQVLCKLKKNKSRDP